MRGISHSSRSHYTRGVIPKIMLVPLNERLVMKSANMVVEKSLLLFALSGSATSLLQICAHWAARLYTGPRGLGLAMR